MSVVIALALCGCVDVHFGLANLMSADHSPRTAVLAPGYLVQDAVIHRGDRHIGVTYAHNPQSEAIIVFCGGNTFHRSIEGGEALQMLTRNADVVLFDYPGYGDSSGPATPAILLEDALAVYDHAMARESTAGKKRVLYGFSMGGMVAAQVAGQRAVDGLVLEATAPSVDAWARTQIPWYAKPIVRAHIEPDLASIDTFAALRSFGGEVLVMTSPADEQAPASLSIGMDREFRRMGLHTVLVQFPGAAHGAIPRSPEYGAVLAAFLDRVKGRNDSLRSTRESFGASFVPSASGQVSTASSVSGLVLSQSKGAARLTAISSQISQSRMQATR